MGRQTAKIFLCAKLVQHKIRFDHDSIAGMDISIQGVPFGSAKALVIETEQSEHLPNRVVNSVAAIELPDSRAS